MAISKGKNLKRSDSWLDVDRYMNHQEPNTDRSTWTKSNPWSFGMSGRIKEMPRREFDADMCDVCGGLGRIWVDGGKSKRRRIQTSIACPKECCYTRHW